MCESTPEIVPPVRVMAPSSGNKAKNVWNDISVTSSVEKSTASENVNVNVSSV